MHGSCIYVSIDKKNKKNKKNHDKLDAKCKLELLVGYDNQPKRY